MLCQSGLMGEAPMRQIMGSSSCSECLFGNCDSGVELNSDFIWISKGWGEGRGNVNLIGRAVSDGVQRRATSYLQGALRGLRKGNVGDAKAL